MRIAVIGAGIMGASAAAALAARGRNVVVHDRAFPNPQGSSFGDARLLRMAYFEHPAYVPLLQEAVAGWRDLERVAGVELFQQVGALYIGPLDGALAAGSLRSARDHGLDHDILNAVQLRDRFPWFSPPAASVGFFDADGGYVRATAAVSATLRSAVELGATLKTSEVTGLDGTTICCAGGNATYDRVVVCAGPWSARFLADENLSLRVTRQVVSWTDVAGFEGMPVFVLEDPDGPFWYGIPKHAGAPGVKFAKHVPGPVVEPECFESDARADEDAVIRPARERWLPTLRGEVSLKSCLYTLSADGHFCLGFRGGDARIPYAAGFSGHGFKFGPAIGAVLADMAESGAIPERAQFLAADRGGHDTHRPSRGRT